MKTRGIAVGVVLALALSAHAQWSPVAPGVQYRRYTDKSRDIHVTRIDLRNDAIRIVGSEEADRGLTVSAFAAKRKAIVAINGDYFDKAFAPIGLTIGPCGRWQGTKDTAREGVVAIGDMRARIDPQRVVMEPPEDWIDAAVSGWPMLITNCDPLTAAELPGSDAFTRAPHPRTAAGLTRSGRYLFFVVADGRRPGVPGLTLAELGAFMREELRVCSAINLDGGGSSAMWVAGRIVNVPADGFERSVSNHLAVVLRKDDAGCLAEIAKASQ